MAAFPEPLCSRGCFCEPEVQILGSEIPGDLFFPIKKSDFPITFQVVVINSRHQAQKRKFLFLQNFTRPEKRNFLFWAGFLDLAKHTLNLVWKSDKLLGKNNIPGNSALRDRDFGFTKTPPEHSGSGYPATTGPKSRDIFENPNSEHPRA